MKTLQDQLLDKEKQLADRYLGLVEFGLETDDFLRANPSRKETRDRLKAIAPIQTEILDLMNAHLDIEGKIIAESDDDFPEIVRWDAYDAVQDIRRDLEKNLDDQQKMRRFAVDSLAWMATAYVTYELFLNEPILSTGKATLLLGLSLAVAQHRALDRGLLSLTDKIDDNETASKIKAKFKQIAVAVLKPISNEDSLVLFDAPSKPKKRNHHAQDLRESKP